MCMDYSGFISPSDDAEHCLSCRMMNNISLNDRLVLECPADYNDMAAQLDSEECGQSELESGITGSLLAEVDSLTL